MRIATWNVNSLRVRLPQVLDWLSENQPDILGLQETKLTDEAFPSAEVETAGFYWVHNGQKSYNGVALLSRHRLFDVTKTLPHCDNQQKRLIAATVQHATGPLRIICVYVVNGQAVGTEKFEYKLQWLDWLRDYLRGELDRYPRVAVIGDYNIAPEDRDVHDPDAWANQILCSAMERQRFRALLDLGFQDCFRLFEQPCNVFTWWDYRQGSFRRNRGLRIDHVLASATLAADCTDCLVDTTPRRHPRPSDHAPVVATFSEK